MKGKKEEERKSSTLSQTDLRAFSPGLFAQRPVFMVVMLLEWLAFVLTATGSKARQSNLKN